MYAMQIQTGELRETDLPNGYGEWSDYAKFAVTFAPRDRDLCSEAASDAFARWRRTGEVPRTLEELRACLWYEQRRWRFLGREPDTEGMRYAGAVIRAMRTQLGSRPGAGSSRGTASSTGGPRGSGRATTFLV